LVREDVDRALREDRSVVLTWTLRGTRHYHRAEDVRWLVGVLGLVFNRPGSARARQLGIAGEAGDRAVRALCRALADEGPLTRAEVKDRLAAHGVDPSGQAAIHVIGRAALEGLLVVVPAGRGRGEPERYVLLDDWVPAGGEGTVGELVRRYLQGYGPATVADFAGWSGMSGKAATEAFRSVGGGLTEVRVRAGEPLWAMGDPEVPGRAPVRLTGAFDNVILGYASREAHLDPAHAAAVNRGGGMVKPVVVADGRVVGTWAYRAGGRVEVRPFVSGSVGRRPVETEARDVGLFLGNPQARAEMPIPPGVVAP
jgi:hypothetical protein